MTLQVGDVFDNGSYIFLYLGENSCFYLSPVRGNRLASFSMADPEGPLNISNIDDYGRKVLFNLRDIMNDALK